MSPKDADVYLLSGAGDDEWVNPTPARSAIEDAVTAATDLEPDDIDDIEAYVHPDEIRRVVDGDDDSLNFEVEGHEVTVSANGEVTVAD